jgi:hypothetical protein
MADLSGSRAQAAYEYIALLAFTSLIVALAIVFLREGLLPTVNRQLQAPFRAENVFDPGPIDRPATPHPLSTPIPGTGAEIAYGRLLIFAGGIVSFVFEFVRAEAGLAWALTAVGVAILIAFALARIFLGRK